MQKENIRGSSWEQNNGPFIDLKDPQRELYRATAGFGCFGRGVLDYECPLTSIPQTSQSTNQSTVSAPSHASNNP